jgi:hypothetical protein
MKRKTAPRSYSRPMTTLYRHQTVWGGIAGMPATTTLYSTAIPIPANIKAFYTAIKTYLPNGLSLSIKGSGDTIEDSTGVLNGTWNAGGDLSESGGPTALAYAAAAGALVRFSTTTIVHGHRLRGRMFVVPVNSVNFSTSGGISSSMQTAMQTAASSLVSGFSGSLVVWSRPFDGTPAAGGRPANPARSGSNGIVTGATVPAAMCVLRSRRD